MLSLRTIAQPMTERMRPIRSVDKNKILLHEIYASVQGESTYMGKPCVFVRTSGCHLRCSYCDTEHAFFEGQAHSIEEILAQVAQFGIGLVELTGGEPLLQKLSFTLLERLVHEGYTVLLETSGAVSIKSVHKNVKVILDIKTPSSGHSDKNVWSNLSLLWPGCELKFVLQNFADYDFAVEICQRYDLFNKNPILFSPVVSQMNARELAEKIVHDKLPVRFQMQLHRILFGEEKGK